VLCPSCLEETFEGTNKGQTHEKGETMIYKTLDITLLQEFTVAAHSLRNP